MKKLLILLYFSIVSLIYSYSQDTYQIEITNQSREYALYIPISKMDTGNYPLIILLHSYNTGMTDIGEYTTFVDLFKKEQFYLACPQSVTSETGISSWNAGEKFKELTKNIDDVAFISTLIDSLKIKYRINPNKIFIVGYSNGAMMAYKAALHLSDKITAMACVSGLMIETSYTPKNPVPILHIHGDNDLEVPHSGVQQYGFEMPPVDSVIKKWLKWNHCSTVPNVLAFNNNLTALKWSGAAEVRLYLLHGAGHDWPTYTRNSWSATDEIWHFFIEVSQK